MKIKYFIIGLLSAGLMACGNNPSAESHEGHDHSEHATEEAGHEGHDHSKHAEEEAGHEGHNHENEGEEHDTAHPGEEESGHEHNGLITLSAQKAKEAGITVAKAEKKLFSDIIPAIGEVLPMQGDIVAVTAKNEGFVVFDSKKIISGTAVNNGEKLMVITTAGITQDGYSEIVSQANIAYNTAKEAYERNKALYADQLVTATQLQASEAAFKSAELKLENLRKGFEKDGLKVSSPISGYVTDFYVQEGDYVQLGQTLFTVSKNRNVMLKAEVSPEYMSKLPKVVSANFRTSASGNFLSVKALGGRVTSYGRNVNSESLLVPVYFTLPYNSDFVAGSYAEIKLVLNEGATHIVVPQQALVEDFGHYFVYVADEHGYEKRDVQIGGRDGINVEILSGIKEGENIVVTGSARLKLIERLGSLGSEAAHAGHKH